MDNYRKSSVKLLPIIKSSNNKLILYTQFDSKFDVDDKLYIIVYDNTSSEYLILDSLYNKLGYKLLEIDGNKITLDINYDNFYKNFNSNTLSVDCFITKIFINKSIINKGVINNSIIKETKIQPSISSKLIWKQSILIDIVYEIKNVNFNSKTSNTDLILKSVVNDNNEIESYYTYNNNRMGISIININNNIDKTFNITNSNIYYGIFNNVLFQVESNDTINYIISGGTISNSIIGENYTINNGTFINCEFISSNIKWNYGVWDNKIFKEFKPMIWYDGIWLNGELNNTTIWKNGSFNGDNSIFNGKLWENGIFNNGTISNSNWENGTFNNGTISNSNWNNGTFNNGNIIFSNWKNGTFNNGTFNNSTWDNGIFNNGTISNSNWENGTFNNGTISNSNWYNGVLYNGVFKDSQWIKGSWYNGIMDKSGWENGTVYYGIFNNIIFQNGKFNNGLMNNSTIWNIDWYNGISNNNIFSFDDESIINWYSGSFNNGIFGGKGKSIWYNGEFYSGTFIGQKWYNGISYICVDTNNIIDSKYKLNKPYKPYKEFNTFTSILL